MSKQKRKIITLKAFDLVPLPFCLFLIDFLEYLPIFLDDTLLEFNFKTFVFTIEGAVLLVLLVFISGGYRSFPKSLQHLRFHLPYCSSVIPITLLISELLHIGVLINKQLFIDQPLFGLFEIIKVSLLVYCVYIFKKSTYLIPKHSSKGYFMIQKKPSL